MANLPQRNNNPGDLKDPTTGTFRSFTDPQQGMLALQHDLIGKMTGATATGLKPTSTLSEFANTWAPASDKNDPMGYANKLATQLGVPVNTPIGSLQSRVGDFAKAIATNEGFYPQTAYADTNQNAAPQIDKTKMGPATFAKLIRDKTGAYQDVPDDKLTQAVLAKYPVYADKVAGPAPLQPGQEGYVDPNANKPMGWTHDIANSLYQTIAGPVANSLARPGQLVQHLAGGEGDTSSISGDLFGLPITDPYADVQGGKSVGAATESAVGEAAQTVAADLGMGAAKQGALYFGGQALKQNDQLLPSLDHPFENAIAQTAIGGLVGKATDLGVRYLGKTLTLFGEGLKTSSAAQSLLDSAAKNWENILAPTTKAFKTATNEVAPELAQSGQIFTSRGDFLRAAEATVNKAGDVIDTVWNSVPEGTKMNVEDVAKYMLKSMGDLQVTGGAGNKFVPIENEPLYKALDAKVQELIKLTDENGQIDVNTLRAWRQSGDAFIQKSKPYQFAASEADKATVGAAKSATRGARAALNDKDTGIRGLADANKAFHIWDTAKDIMDATLLRKTGQAPTGLTETINTMGGLAAGARYSVTHALEGAMLMKYATRLARSTLVQSSSAAFKNWLARGIMNNDGNMIVRALLTLVKGGGITAKVVGDFLQGLPDGAKLLAQKDILGLSEKDLTEALGGGTTAPYDRTGNNPDGIARSGGDTSRGGFGVNDTASNSVRSGETSVDQSVPNGVGSLPGSELAGNNARGRDDRNLNPQTLERMPPAPAANKVVDSLIKYIKNIQPGLSMKNVTEKDGFAGFEDVSTKTLESLVGRKTISKQFLLDATNRPELKQAERDVLRKVLDEYNGVESGVKGAKEIPASKIEIPVQNFADKVKAELLPLKRVALKNPRYENINLTDAGNARDLRGPVADYRENIYESPIKTSAGRAHFRSDTENYFAHTRVEDLPKDTRSGYDSAGNSLYKKGGGDTRRVIELQSDLFQKGRLEDEVKRSSLDVAEMKLSAFEQAKEEGDAMVNTHLFEDGEKHYVKVDKAIEDARAEVAQEKESISSRNSELSKLEPYRNTWHERVIREEVKQAAKDGKTNLLFPTGETAMNIEGLVNRADKWVTLDNKVVDGTNIKEGDLITYQTHEGTPHPDRRFLVVKNRGDGVFDAVDSMTAENDVDFHNILEKKGLLDDGRVPTLEELSNTGALDDKEIMADLRGMSEQLSAKDTVDPEDPIYRFYEKEVGRYLAKKYNATKITDPQGVSWFEVKVPKEAAKKPVDAFGKTTVGTMATAAAGGAAGASLLVNASKNEKRFKKKK